MTTKPSIPDVADRALKIVADYLDPRIERLERLERKRRENRRQLDRLMLSGRTHGATLHAIERRQERDLKLTRELARLEAEIERNAH